MRSAIVDLLPFGREDIDRLQPLVDEAVIDAFFATYKKQLWPSKRNRCRRRQTEALCLAGWEPGVRYERWQSALHHGLPADCRLRAPGCSYGNLAKDVWWYRSPLETVGLELLVRAAAEYYHSKERHFDSQADALRALLLLPLPEIEARAVVAGLGK